MLLRAPEEGGQGEPRGLPAAGRGALSGSLPGPGSGQPATETACRSGRASPREVPPREVQPVDPGITPSGSWDHAQCVLGSRPVRLGIGVIRRPGDARRGAHARTVIPAGASGARRARTDQAVGSGSPPGARRGGARGPRGVGEGGCCPRPSCRTRGLPLTDRSLAAAADLARDFHQDPCLPARTYSGRDAVCATP